MMSVEWQKESHNDLVFFSVAVCEKSHISFTTFSVYDLEKNIFKRVVFVYQANYIGVFMMFSGCILSQSFTYTYTYNYVHGKKYILATERYLNFHG